MELLKVTGVCPPYGRHSIEANLVAKGLTVGSGAHVFAARGCGMLHVYYFTRLSNDYNSLYACDCPLDLVPLGVISSYGLSFTLICSGESFFPRLTFHHIHAIKQNHAAEVAALLARGTLELTIHAPSTLGIASLGPLVRELRVSPQNASSSFKPRTRKHRNQHVVATISQTPQGQQRDGHAGKAFRITNAQRQRPAHSTKTQSQRRQPAIHSQYTRAHRQTR